MKIQKATSGTVIVLNRVDVILAVDAYLTAHGLTINGDRTYECVKDGNDVDILVKVKDSASVTKVESS